MYRIGKEEMDRVARVIQSGKLFRYGSEGECSIFEKRFAQMLNVKHSVMTASGTNSLTAALIGVGIGPGDEVLVPACTYMATPIAVLSAGAIPVIVDIDDSLTLDPRAMTDAIGRCTRAVVPVHMWGMTADMDAVMNIAKDHRLLVVEDVCQAVGGAYEGRMLGSIGDAGAFSFNYYKNITCGEGGAVVTSNDAFAERIKCVVDPCSFYWNGRNDAFAGFTANGARASEFEGAILNAQLDRLFPIIESMRMQRKHILRETAGGDLTPIRANSTDWECGSHVMYILPTEAAAETFAQLTGGTVALKTGRHVYTEGDPILSHRGAHHPALNPFQLEANRNCRKEYSKDMCVKSLDILGRTVFITTHPDNTDEQVDRLIDTINKAAEKTLS